MNQPDAIAALDRRSQLPSAARHVFRLLEGIEHGWLMISLPNGEMQSFGHRGEPVEMRIKDWAVFERVIARGDIGLGETWFDGMWDSDDLARVLTLFAANRECLQRAVHCFRCSSRACATSVAPTRGAAAAATSWPTTISATSSTDCGLMAA
jgi:cyclopropane-fatty-acyl-phospholipid synthase